MPTVLQLDQRIPETWKLHIGLFENVTNAAHLHSQLLAKNSEYEYAFIDPSILVSTLQPLAAVYRALRDLIDPKTSLRTPNVHSETVFSLSPTHNITDSYRRFGISPSSTSVLAIKILDTASFPDYSEADVLSHMQSIITGDELPFSSESIRKFTDVAKVRKYYKLKDLGLVDKLDEKAGRPVRKKSEEETWNDLQMAVLGAMALRSIV